MMTMTTTDRFLEQIAIWACLSIKLLMILAAGHDERLGRETCRPYEQIKGDLREYVEDDDQPTPMIQLYRCMNTLYDAA